MATEKLAEDLARIKLEKREEKKAALKKLRKTIKRLTKKILVVSAEIDAATANPPQTPEVCFIFLIFFSFPPSSFLSFFLFCNIILLSL